MSGAVFRRHRSFDVAARPEGDEARPLPRGHGLMIGAGVSASLWTGIFWAVAQVLG